MSSFDENKKTITEPQKTPQKKWLDVPLPAPTPSGDTPQPKRALFNIPPKSDAPKDSGAGVSTPDVKKSWKEVTKGMCVPEKNTGDTKSKSHSPQK